MTFTKSFTYTTTGSVEVENVVMSCDKRNGNIVVEFDARGKDWVSGSPYPQAKIKYGGVTKSTLDLTNLSNSLKRYRVIWFAGGELALINHGSQSVVLDVDDEDDTTQTFTHSVVVDLDPVEFHFTDITDIDFSDDSTPDFTFRLKELHNPNTMITPTIKVGSGSPAGATLTAYNMAGSSTAFASGFLVLGGKKFSELDGITWKNTASGGEGDKGLFSEIDYYKVTVPTLSAGTHSVTLDLVCTDIT